MAGSRRLIRHVAAFALLLVLFSFLSPFSRPSRKPIPIVKSGFDWGSLPLAYPIESMRILPQNSPRQLPKIQYAFPQTFGFTRQDSRRKAVKKAFQKCWQSYKNFAWGKDELKPLSLGAKNEFGGWGVTLIDSLDTLWIMDLKDEFYEAVEAVALLDWENTNSTSCNIFETTIRHLGGLLSAYDLSQEPVLLDKAIELGDMLYAGFDTPNRLPPFWLDFQKARAGNLVADNHIPSASPGSLSLEFTRLAQITGNSKYYDAIARVTDLLEKHQGSTKLPGMWPTFLDLQEEIWFRGNSFTLGALADSLYEYFPKMYALLGGAEPVYENLYKASSMTIKEHILFRPMLPNNADILFSGTVNVNDEVPALNPEGQHLSCFVGGMFGIAGRLFGLDDHVDLGLRLTEGCIWAYNAFPSGIMPEIFAMVTCESLDGCEWDEERWKRDGDERLPKGFSNARAPSYSLRPEAIESVFILYRITGKAELREAAWQMFQSIQRETETEFGNAAITNVTITGSEKKDSMESFWLSETLKYFYLIFSDPDLINLDEYVLNTEAHPLKRPI